MDNQLALVEVQPPSRACTGCVALMAVFCSFDSGVVWLTQAELGRRIGVVSRTVRRHLGHLVTEGAIHVRRQGQGRPNVYTVAAESVGAALRDVSRAPRRPRSRVSDPERTSVSAKHSPRTSSSGNTKKANTAPKRAACAAAFSRSKSDETIAVLSPAAAKDIGIAGGDEATALVGALEQHGVDARAARTFVATVPAAAIVQQIRWLPDREPKNPGAVLAEAIRHGYGEPTRSRIERVRAEAAAVSERRRAEQQTTAVAASDRENAEALELAAAESAIAPTRQAEIRADVERDYYASLPARIREAARGGIGARAAIASRSARAIIAEYRAQRTMSKAESSSAVDRAGASTRQMALLEVG